MIEPIWTTKDGRNIPVKDMEYSHLLAVRRILVEAIEDIEDSDEVWDSPRLYKSNFGDLKIWREVISGEIANRGK